MCREGESATISRVALRGGLPKASHGARAAVKSKPLTCAKVRRGSREHYHGDPSFAQHRGSARKRPSTLGYHACDTTERGYERNDERRHNQDVGRAPRRGSVEEFRD